MAQSPFPQQWEDVIRNIQEANHRELEAQRKAAHQEARAQIDASPALTSASAALPVGRLQPDQSSKPSFRRCQEGISELEAMWSSPPPYRQQAPLAPPAANGLAPDADTNVQIRQLQREINNREVNIRCLESEVEAEKDTKRRLQAERHEAVDAQRRAEGEIWRLRKQVANLDELLDASVKREKELESELDLAREEIAKLKRRLHEEQSSYESDLRAQEMREKRIKQQLEDTHIALEEEVRRNRHLAAGPADRQVQDETPSRARRSKKSTSGKTFISRPKGGNLRDVWIFT